MGVVSRTIARSLRPKRKPVLQEPLTPGTPLRGGGRAPTISEQTGLERPLIEEQVGIFRKSAKAFRAAFSEAVRDGEKTFMFEGRKYNTKRMADRVGVKIPKRKPTPSAKKAMGGMVGKKPRNANIDYRKGGMFYVGGTSARVTPINKGKK